MKKPIMNRDGAREALIEESQLQLQTRRAVKPKIGVFGIGLATYWPQFPALKERLEGYQHEIEVRLGQLGANVVSAGLLDTPAAAREAGERFLQQGVDLLVCYVGTYATSSQVLPIVHRNKAPVIVLNLQPTAALDYERTDTQEWLANCSVCCVPEIANTFARAGVPFQVVSGMRPDHTASSDRI